MPVFIYGQYKRAVPLINIKGMPIGMLLKADFQNLVFNKGMLLEA